MSGATFFPAISPPAVPPSNTSPTTFDSNSDARRVFRDLEANFLSMLLKEMRQTFEPDGGLFPGDTGDVQGGLFDLFMGQHLAAAGGFGLAAALDRQLRTPSHADHRPPPAGGTVAGPTGR
jgi:peptidoglycan hydrolase FlgJ